MLLIASAAAVMDLKCEKISNYWIIFSWATGLFWQFQKHGWCGGLYFLMGAVVPILGLFVLFLYGMLGAGDIKLLSALGGIMGVHSVLLCILLSFLFGAVLSLAILIACGNFFQRLKYFRDYITICLVSGTRESYRKPGKRPEHIHFTIPIMMSVLLFAGGFYS